MDGEKEEDHNKYRNVPPLITGPMTATNSVPMSAEEEQELQNSSFRGSPPPYTPSASTTSAPGSTYSGPTIAVNMAAAPPMPPMPPMPASPSQKNPADFEPPTGIPPTRETHGHSPAAPYPQPARSAAPPRQDKPVKRSGDIKSNSSLDLVGPMEVNGSVKSYGNINFIGDFRVKDKVDAYGSIEVNGDLVGNDKMTAYGSIRVVGRAIVRDKIKAYGKLSIIGECEAGDNVDVWGALIVKGHLRCKKLTVWGSVTVVGEDSWYEATDKESIWGSKDFKREGDIQI